MAKFGIRFTEYANAHPATGKPLPYDQWQIFEGYVFDTFDEAKRFADCETEYSRPRRDYYYNPSQSNPRTQYMAYKLPPEEDHVMREQERVERGDYVPMPEHMAPASYDYVHPRIVERDGKKLIGYYETVSDAQLDRLKEVKPTKYFAYFFGADSKETWDYMAELGLVSGEVSLKILKSRKDIRFAYENGPESCMSGAAEIYYSEGSPHPTEVYATPDIGLAILYRGDDWKENIVARALVAIKSKEYIRIYGDIHRMEKILEEKGYHQNQYALGGCRLLKIYADERKNALMLPYLDGACTRVVLDNNDKYLTIKEEERILVGTTAGYVRI